MEKTASQRRRPICQRSWWLSLSLSLSLPSTIGSDDSCKWFSSVLDFFFFLFVFFRVFPNTHPSCSPRDFHLFIRTSKEGAGCRHRTATRRLKQASGNCSHATREAPSPMRIDESDADRAIQLAPHLHNTQPAERSRVKCFSRVIASKRPTLKEGSKHFVSRPLWGDYARKTLDA